MSAEDRQREAIAQHLNGVAERIVKPLEGSKVDERLAGELRKVIASELASVLPVLDDDEREAMDLLLAFMETLQRWGLRVNQEELAQAIHVLQGFVITRMLSRKAPHSWSNWYTAGQDELARRRVTPEPDDGPEQADGHRVTVQILGPWRTIATAPHSANWAGLEGEETLRELLASEPPPAPGAIARVSSAVADRLVALGVAELLEGPEA